VEGAFVPVKPHFDMILSIALVLALVVGTAATLWRGKLEHMANPAAATAQSLPDTYFYDTSDRQVTLADFRGKVVLVNLWATWCPPCVVELPALDSLQAKLKDKNFKVVAISQDTSSLATITSFLQGKDVTHIDAYWDKDRQIPMKWRYDGLPVSFLLDADGRVVRRFDGPYAWDKGEMFAEISGMLK
jgi:thiol-disulfide isomerase/thioredoxin